MLLDVEVVVSSATVPMLEPPPQPNMRVIVASKEKTKALLLALNKFWVLFIIGKYFSRCLHYFIVAGMNTTAHTLKFQSAQYGFFSAFQVSVAVVALLLSLMAPLVAHAEWQKVTTTDSGIIYVDDGTIKRSGPIRSFWSLLDYRTPQKAQRGAYFVSTRTHMEMDCRKEMVHILQFSMHSGPMLTGEIVDSQGVMREWQTIPPDTPLVSLFKFVCGK